MNRGAVLALLALACVSCSSSSTDSTTPTPDSGTPAAAGTDIHVTSFKFTPATVTVKAGDTVTWHFDDGFHNVVSGASCVTDGSFTSGDAKAAPYTFSRVFPTAGTFEYFCNPHCLSAGMKGTVTVQ